MREKRCKSISRSDSEKAFLSFFEVNIFTGDYHKRLEQIICIQLPYNM